MFSSIFSVMKIKLVKYKMCLSVWCFTVMQAPDCYVPLDITKIANLNVSSVSI